MINKDFGSIYFWMHSSFSALSIGYFLSLLSASSQTQEALAISFASICFCISLIVNSGMAIFLLWFGDSEAMINRIYPLYPWHNLKSVPTIAIISFLVGLIFLLGFYSYWLVLLAIAASVIVYIVIYNTLHTLMDENFESKLQQLRDLDKGDR